jgi:hypothetical protein
MNLHDTVSCLVLRGGMSKVSFFGGVFFFAIEDFHGQDNIAFNSDILKGFNNFFFNIECRETKALESLIIIKRLCPNRIFG